MLQQRLFSHPMLLNAYVFTNHSRENVLTSWDEKGLGKAPLVHDSTLREQFADFELSLPSQYSSRVKQGGLGASARFQASAHKSLDEFFGISELKGIEQSALEKVLEKGVESNQSYPHEHFKVNSVDALDSIEPFGC